MKLTKMQWAGWILSGLIGIFLLFGAGNALLGTAMVVKGLGQVEFPMATLIPIGLTEALCALLYLLPRTAFLGSILMTAYFGGAVAAHARLGQGQWVVPVVFGVLVWVGLGLRDARLKTMLG